MTKRVNVILCLTSELFTCHLIARNSLQVFTAADLQEKGKAGYQAVFNTLMQLALKAQGIFEQKVVFFIDSFTFFFDKMTGPRIDGGFFFCLNLIIK